MHLRTSFLLCLLALSACSGLNPAGAGPTLPGGTETVPAAGSGKMPEVVGTSITELAANASQPASTGTPVPTETANPENTPVPGPCQPGDLYAEVRTNVSTGPDTFTVSLSNAGNGICILQGSPQGQLIGPQGIPLDLDVSSMCYRCDQAAAGRTSQPAVTPEGTELPQPSVTGPDALTGSMELKPQASVKILLVWSNWCFPFPPGGVLVRLTLPSGGKLDLPTDAGRGGQCSDPKQRSTLQVSQYIR